MGRVDIDMSFSARFAVEVGRDIRADETNVRVYFPGATSKGGRDGVIVDVAPHHGPSWTGVFAFGPQVPTAVTGVFTTPDEMVLCVVSRGLAYFTRADDYTAWSQVDLLPVEHVLPVTSHHLLILGDRTRLLAFGARGLAWETRRIASDGFTVTELGSGSLTGMASSAPDRREVAFLVDLASGRVDGGTPET
jgi:hypothetical protein